MGKLGKWKIGMMEDWKGGMVEDWKNRPSTTQPKWIRANKGNEAKRNFSSYILKSNFTLAFLLLALSFILLASVQGFLSFITLPLNNLLRWKISSL
jgi:hypothetical protein